LKRMENLTNLPRVLEVQKSNSPTKSFIPAVRISPSRICKIKRIISEIKHNDIKNVIIINSIIIIPMKKLLETDTFPIKMREMKT